MFYVCAGNFPYATGIWLMTWRRTRKNLSTRFSPGCWVLIGATPTVDSSPSGTPSSGPSTVAPLYPGGVVNRYSTVHTSSLLILQPDKWIIYSIVRCKTFNPVLRRWWRWSLDTGCGNERGQVITVGQWKNTSDTLVIMVSLALL